VERNLERVEDLLRDAHREHSPRVLVLPEGFTGPNVYAGALLGAPRPIDGPPFQMLMRLARELDVVIAGGFLSVRGHDAYGTYVLAEPSGAAHLHDKDIPTAWEQNYYRGGDDPGVFASAALGCTVGLMSGWEWARYRTSARVRAGAAGLVLGGMCWPSMPLNWGVPLRRWVAREHAIWRAQAAELPGQVARLTGAPVAIAAHVGPVAGETPFVRGVPWCTEMLGESQICDRDGNVLARLGLQDGEGHVAADVHIEEPSPSEAIQDRFWIPRLTLASRLAWHGLNAHGALGYRVRRLRGAFPWQAAAGGDLPDEIPPRAAQ